MITELTTQERQWLRSIRVSWDAPLPIPEQDYQRLAEQYRSDLEATETERATMRESLRACFAEYRRLQREHDAVMRRPLVRAALWLQRVWWWLTVTYARYQQWRAGR